MKYQYKFCSTYKYFRIKINSVTPTGVLNKHKSVISISSVTPTGVPTENKSVISISPA